MPTTYTGIDSIIKQWETLPSPGGLYTSNRVDRENIRTVQFLLFSSAEVDDYVNENDRIVPEQLAGQGYRSWLDSATLQGIVENKIEFNEQASADDIVEAIFYYLEQDTYMDE
ncbi:hypothetical protein INH39_26860 [Massilia violaceinigra]|uniref:DUF7716 domain-containing protein n=1 Tax=Massilia violaceinigra TaxID=2045208 RepID=A0ABY4A2M6_9BURK|nr:hypothetical protein [Massilia violaceinigra]UOD29014.1 hypothetical protein INH39_26860 [Massilia violaceinigra]